MEAPLWRPLRLAGCLASARDLSEIQELRPATSVTTPSSRGASVASGSQFLNFRKGGEATAY